MTKGIRGKILIVSAIAVVGVLVAWFVVVDSVVRSRIERVGTRLVGAKVELAKADVSLFPLALTLTRLQVTNPDEPMTNTVEVERISFRIDGWKLLKKKTIIEEMSVEGVKFGTRRSTSGATTKSPAAASVPDGLGLPSFNVPDIKEILEAEELASIKLIEELEEDVNARWERWTEQVRELLGRKKIKRYRVRFEKLVDDAQDGDGVGDVVKMAGELRALDKEIREDLKRIRKARNGFRNELRVLRHRVKEAARAPMEDVRRITGKYALSNRGLANMSRLVLGSALDRYVDAALKWRARLAPVFEQDRTEGEKADKSKKVDFSRDPEPDFLISRTSVSILIPAGEITGRITNITSAQDRLGKPMRFVLEAKGLDGLSSLRLDGEINRIRPNVHRDRLRARLRGYALKDLTLSPNASFPIVINDGKADMELRASIDGRKLSATLKARLSSVAITAGAHSEDERGPVERALTSALSGVKGFKVKATAGGTTDDYELRVTSDLDRVLKNSVGRFATREAASLEARLRPGVLKKTRVPLERLYSGMNRLTGIEEELKKRIGLGDDLVKELASGTVKTIPGLPF